MTSLADEARAPVSTPRVVVLTSGNRQCAWVLERLAARRVPVVAVLVQCDALAPSLFRARVAVLVQCDALAPSLFRARGWRRARELPVAAARSLVRLRRAWRWRRTLRPLAPRVVVTGTRNGRRMERDLRRLRPDLLLLAGVGLVSDALLRIPAWGALNAHPALLPWVRGNGVVAHSIERGVAVGATVHWADAGIDRGAIVERRLLAVAPGQSLDDLELAAVLLAADLLADLTAEAVARRVRPPAVAQKSLHPLCRWMTPDERALVARAVARGRAVALFERWRARCEPPEPPWRLPPTADQALDHASDDTPVVR